MVGDFNLISREADKSNDKINRSMMARFRRMLNMLELKEVYLNGRRYTWTNERERATLVKLDHVFMTNDWEDIFPSCFLTAISSAISDHCPMVLDFHANLHWGRRF